MLYRFKEVRDIQEYTVAEIIAKIDEASTVNNTYITLKDYYKGNSAILSRASADAAKPNNKIVNNFAKYITDVNVGYFIGRPVTYTATEEGAELKDILQDIFDYNDEQDENAQLAKVASIKGVAYELLYVDEEANPRFNYVEPDNLILIYDKAITPTPLMAIRYEQNDIASFAELYTKTDIIYYESGKDFKDLAEVSRTANPWGDIPVIEFLNNEEGMGDFETVLSEIDAYDKAQSDTANDFEYFADAYLLLKNLSGTSEDEIASAKSKRVLLVDGDGDASWLTKTMQDTATENYKTRLQTDIHRFSMTPNLTDENFAGNLSGVALEFKLWGLEQLAVYKERKFKRGLQRRIELLCNFLKLKTDKEEDWRKININFTRNIPMNVPDMVDMVVKLNGIISQQTLLARLPFIDDPAKELEQIEAESEGMVNLDLIPDEFADNETPKIENENQATEKISVEEATE